MKISIKEYTNFVAQKCGKNLNEFEIDDLMKSFGFWYNQEVDT